MDQWIASFSNLDMAYVQVYLAAMRYLAPVLAVILLFRCCKPLLTFQREPEIWAWLCPEKGERIPVIHWENVIGRSKHSDIVINLPSVSRNHAVLIRYDDGSWTVSDARSQNGVWVNGERVSICAVTPKDTIRIGEMEMTLEPITKAQEKQLIRRRTVAYGAWDSLANVLILTVFQVLCEFGFLLSGGGENGIRILTGFTGIILVQWVLLAFNLLIRRTSFEVETLAFFLTTMGMAVVLAIKPEETVKQLTAVYLGIGMFLLIGWSVRNLERAKKIRYLAGVMGIALLAVTLLFGKEYYGAKNWLVLGSISLQPSELTKLCFVYIGASTLDRLMEKRNLIGFILYSVVICALLAMMNDFGGAMIFFCAFLMIAYLRSGSVGTVGLACTALVLAGVIALKLAPHALQRFASWRHIWEDPLDAGFQQTRALMCLAAGGLFGLGLGQGWMTDLFAADSDVVFAAVSEEWGLLMALMMALSIAVLGIFAVRCASMGRSSFYVIAACTAAAILVVQTVFNVLGTLDILPFTGVTFPFVSNGGSGMISAWGLLAFIKAADTRQNASFAVRLHRNRGARHE